MTGARCAAWVCRILGLLSLVVLSLVVLPLTAAGQTPPPPVQFETRADLILIDANIVDDTGAPIPDLTAADVVVSIDGKPRPLASMQFVRSDPPAARPGAPPRAAHYSSNEGVGEGRRIMLVVDENSIPPGGARAVLMSTERFLAGLAPADRAALIRLPTFEGSVDFTTDRQRVFEAVKKVFGRAARGIPGRASVAEAVAFDRREQFEWQRALARICANLTGIDLELCRSDAEAEATERISMLRQRSRETLNALAQLLSNVRQLPGPKTLVLISQGFLGYDMTLDISRLADAAAAARVSFYALHLDMQSFDIAESQPSATRMDDERIMAEGIDHLAGASRGTRFRVVGSGEGIFARVAREISGYYLLGLEPTDADRDGKPHRIKVEVKRPSATVRARAQFTIGGEATAETATTPTQRLLELLRAPGPEAGIPLRVAAFVAPSSTPDVVTVMVGADIGAPSTRPLPVHIGVLLIDKDGKIVKNQAGSVTLQPVQSEQPVPPRYFGSVEVPAGEYTLRLAVLDADERGGSVHHPIDARVKRAGDVRVSDLIITTPLRGDTGLRPDVHLTLDGNALQAILELGADNAALLDATRVRFEVAEEADGTPLVTQAGVLRTQEGTVKPAAAVLDVGVLPPGRYVARAVIDVPGAKPLSMTRPFDIAPRRQRAAAKPDTGPAATSPAASPRSASRGRVRPPIPPFKKEDVLAPAVVNPFIDHVLAQYSPSPAAKAALNAIKSGDLENATKGDRQVGDLGMSFAQGLSLLAADRAKEADAYFRAALRSSSDFIGAAFYLGATLAASGRDRDAVGAWQTALIGDVGAAGVYPVLIDGLLRLNEGDQALEILAEAEPTFTDRDQYNRRLVQAYAVSARYDEALTIAHEYLARQPNDADMLFLTMHLMYERHASGTSAAGPDLERFRDYAAKYSAAGGTQSLVVQGWRKALGIR